MGNVWIIYPIYCGNGKDYPIYEKENKKSLKPPIRAFWQSMLRRCHMHAEVLGL